MEGSGLLWKEEPLSPLSYEQVTEFSEDTFYHTISNVNFEEYDIKFETHLAECESKAEVATHILENLEKLMDLDDLIKEEPFLLDEKMLPPILDEVEPPRAVPVAEPQAMKLDYMKSPDTQYLLKEFENVYDVVELAHGTLTPPQSPPSGSNHLMFTTLEPLDTPYNVLPAKQTVSSYSVPDKQLLPQGLSYRPNISIDFAPAATPQPDIDHELAVVEELVRTRVEDMQWSSSGPSSPCSSSSNSSTFGDSSTDDPEWTPQESPDSPSDTSNTTKKARKRPKPYARNLNEDKKSRKKEQNKNAATRYRMKKKAEVEEILSEEKELRQHNNELVVKMTDVQREIKYLKGLMRDLFKAKGLIN